MSAAQTAGFAAADGDERARGCRRCAFHIHSQALLSCVTATLLLISISLSLSPPAPPSPVPPPPCPSLAFLSSRCNRWHKRWRVCEASSVKNDSRALTTCSALAWPDPAAGAVVGRRGGVVGLSSETVDGVLQIPPPPPTLKRRRWRKAPLLHLSHDLQPSDLVVFFCRRSCGSNHQSQRLHVLHVPPSLATTCCGSCARLVSSTLSKPQLFTSSDRFLHRWAPPAGRSSHQAPPRLQKSLSTS